MTREINYVRVVKFVVDSIKLNGGKSMLMSLLVFSYKFFCFFVFLWVSIKSCLNFACLIVSLAKEVVFRKVLPFKDNNNVAFAVGSFRSLS